MSVMSRECLRCVKRSFKTNIPIHMNTGVTDAFSLLCLVSLSDDLNVGGIVAGVIVAILLVGLLVFGVWFAYRKGYIPSMSLQLQLCTFFS